MGEHNNGDVRHATREEIEKAFEELTVPQLAKIRGYATWRVEWIARASIGRSWDDLLQEALSLTLEERRHWNKNAVDFVGHLTGVMRSLSSDWAKSLKAAKHEEPMLNSEVSQENDNGEKISVVDGAKSGNPGPEMLLQTKELLSRIKQHLSKDKRVLEIMDGLGEGLMSSEICEIMGLTTQEFNAARKRLERAAKITLRQWREQ